MKNQIAAVLILFLTFVGTSFQQQDQQGSSSSKMSLQGVLEPVETLRLASRDPGIVVEMKVKEGDIVTSGTTIAVLDSDAYQSEFKAAQREFDIAEEESKNDVDLKYAEISADVNGKVLDRSRQANMQFANTVSSTEIERLRLEYERSRLSGEQAVRTQTIKQLTSRLRAEQVEIAKIKLENRVIRSNIDGTVVEVLYSPGEFVNGGYPVARILNLGKLRVKCAGDARNIDPANVNEAALFTYEKDGQTIKVPARITFVSPETDPVRQTFDVWAEVDNAEGIMRAGMVGNLELSTNR